MKNNRILRDLGDGLILRRALPPDSNALIQFNSQVQSDDGPDQPDERVGAWTRDLIESKHPTFNVGDFTIVEETRTKRIVSSMNLISQTWRYDGIPFGVGRPELVGTLPEFRNRGLVRAQFEVIHQWSAERGEKVLAISGIPYYYRQFGYEMALNLSGGKLGFLPQVPRLNQDQEEPYRIRPALEADLPFIARVYEIGSQRSLVNCAWDENLLRYQTFGTSPMNVNRYELRVIEDLQSDRVGFLAHPPMNWDYMLAATVYELEPGLSWASVTPSVIRYLLKTGEAYAAQQGKYPWSAFAFWLGEDHPVYSLFKISQIQVRRPYAWYMRVPDLPDFINHIAPSLERRLADSPLVGYSGELKISFYRTGLRLVFEKGCLQQVESWKPETSGDPAEASFPNLTFLQLLFGYRSLDDLKYAFADCLIRSAEVDALLKILFPKQASNVWPVS